MTYDRILFVSFALFALLLAAHYAGGLYFAGRRRFAGANVDPQAEPAETEGFSVVVVSRNGLEKLRALVPSLLAQKYPKFEIVVVSDRSLDNTEIFLKSVQRNYPTVLRVVSVPVDTTYPWPGRKFAITMGVKAARYPRIVLLDNTAVPQGERWLDTLAQAIDSQRGNEFLIACTGVAAGAGWASADDFRRMSVRIAWASAGKPFAAHASNFVFRKSTFLSRNGYMRDIRVPSGEADFLLQDYACRDNTVAVCAWEALVTDAVALTPAQRRDRDVARWAAFRRYTPSAKARAMYSYILKALFLAAAAAAAPVFWRQWEYWMIGIVPLILSCLTGWVLARRLVYPRWLALGLGVDIVLLPWKLFRTLVAAALLPKGWK